MQFNFKNMYYSPPNCRPGIILGSFAYMRRKKPAQVEKSGQNLYGLYAAEPELEHRSHSRLCISKILLNLGIVIYL